MILILMIEAEFLQSRFSRLGVGRMDGCTTVPHLSGSPWLGDLIRLHSTAACMGLKLRGHTPSQSRV